MVRNGTLFYKMSKEWRRDRDSNPRMIKKSSMVFETTPFDRSGISPEKHQVRKYIKQVEFQYKIYS